MQEKHLFEYAVIRVVPRIEREEFINAGVILYCPKQKFLQALFTLQEHRIHCLCPATDIAEINAHLESYEKIARGDKDAGPIAQLDLPSRFRWLTATRSTVVQSSKVHPGFCTDAAATLKQLHADLIL